jgi:FkbM family methyltransferase
MARLLGWTPIRQFQLRHGLSKRSLRQWPLLLLRESVSGPTPTHVNLRLRRAAARPPRDETEVLWRLRGELRDVPRYVPGSYRFPFGTVRYIDARSLVAQYEKIFRQRVYDFRSGNDSPRIIDCGGSIGLSAIWFRMRYPACSITVFEADPATVPVLEANLIAAGLDDVEVVPAAAWKNEGLVHFRADGADGGAVSMGLSDPEVPAARLADRVTAPVDLLKLDVEGAEYELLQDLHDAGALDNIRRIVAELHLRADNRTRLPPLLVQLADAGFEYTLTRRRFPPWMPNTYELTPFPSVPDAKCELSLYAWKSVF